MASPVGSSDTHTHGTSEFQQWINQDARPRVLIMCETPSHAPKLLILAQEMLGEGRMLPVLAVVSHVPRSMELILTRFQATLKVSDWVFAEAQSFQKNEHVGISENAENTLGRTNHSNILKRLVASLAGPRADFFREAAKFRRMVLDSYRIHKRELYDAGRLLDLINPALVIYFHIGQYASTAVAVVARKRRISNFTLQLKNWADTGAFAKRKKRNIFRVNGPGFRMWKRCIAVMLPYQIWRDHENSALFYSPSETAGRWLAGALPWDPWAFHGGISDMVAIWDDNIKKELFSRGTMGGKYLCTGDPIATELFNTRTIANETRENLYEKYNFDKNRKLIICSTPVLAEHDILSPAKSDIEVDWFFSILSQSGANVLVSVHPRGDFEQRKAQAKKWGLATMDEPLVLAMPACDVYVSVSSTTHRWSMMLGKPAIQLCTWGVANIYESDRSANLYPVLNKGDFDPTLSKVLENATFDKDTQRASEIYVEGAELLDGKSTERILNAIATLATQDRSRIAVSLKNIFKTVRRLFGGGWSNQHRTTGEPVNIGKRE